MNILFFLRKELVELKQCKKIIIYLFVAVLYQTMLNLIANNPVIPLGQVLYLLSFVTACFSAEIVYAEMVEELRAGTFDIILLSRCRIGKIIVVKNLIASCIASIVCFLGIFINNIVAQFVDKMVFISGLRSIDYLLLVFAAIVCGLTTFISMLQMKEISNKIITFNMVAVLSIFVGLYYISFIIGAIQTMTAVLIMIGLLYYSAVNRLKKRKKRENIHNRRLAFSEKDDILLKCIAKRECIKLVDRKNVIRKSVLIVIIFILANTNISRSLLADRILPFAELFILQSVFVMDMYFEFVKDEIYAKMDDILYLVGISRRKNTGIPLIFVIILGCISGLLFVGMNNMIMQCIDRGLLFGIRHFIIYLVTLVLNGYLCQEFMMRFLKSIKEERIVRIYIYFISLILFIVSSVAGGF